jgi:hypothetical protein
MPDNSIRMSREQQAKADFVSAISQLRSPTAELPEASSAFDAITEATLHFATCEQRMRRADRLRVLGGAEEEAVALAESALSYNERGVAALSGVQPLVDTLTVQEPNEQFLSRWPDTSQEIRLEWRDQVTQVDVEVDDAQHLVRIMDECCDAIDEEGLRGLGQYLSRQVEELGEVRRSDDRGTSPRSVFPYWKLVMVAVILGMTAWEVGNMLARGAPWWNFFLVALLACVMTLLAVLLC